VPIVPVPLPVVVPVVVQPLPAMAAPVPNVKLSAYIEKNVTQWINLSEFAMSRLPEPRDKYECLLRHLPAHIALEVTDVINRHMAIPAAQVDWAANYAEFKTSLIARNTDSDQTALKQLLSNTQRGEAKPTVFLRRLRALTEGREIGCEAIIRQSFFSNLPNTVRAALLTLPDHTLDQLATMADSMIEACTSDAPVYAVSVGGAVGGVPAPVAPTLSDSQFGILCSMMSSITADVSALKAKEQKRGRSMSRGRGDRGRSQSRGRNDEENDDYCWYHNRWGNKATTCKPPCIWVAKGGAALTVSAIQTAPVAPPAPVVPMFSISELQAMLHQLLHPPAGNGPTPQ
jgi:hypothetical protein